MRLLILDRDGWACRDCGSKDKNLQIHHCFYEKGDPWLTPGIFLLTLCNECHVTRQQVEADGKKALCAIFALLPIDSVRALTDSLDREASKDVADRILAIFDAFAVDYESNIRWFQYACSHPEFQQAFNFVTGSEVIWTESENE